MQQKIDEYGELFDADSMSSQMTSKLPPIAENDKLEKEVRVLLVCYQPLAIICPFECVNRRKFVA